MKKLRLIVSLIAIFLLIFTNTVYAVEEDVQEQRDGYISEDTYLEDLTTEPFIKIFHETLSEEVKEQLRGEFGEDIEFVPREPLVIYDPIGESYIIDRSVDVVKNGEVIYTEEVYNFPFFSLPERGPELEALIEQMLGEEVRENVYKLKDVSEETVGKIAMASVDYAIENALDLGTEEERLEEILRVSRLQELKRAIMLYGGIALGVIALALLLVWGIKRKGLKRFGENLTQKSFLRWRKLGALALLLIVLIPATIVSANEFIWRNDNYRTGYAPNPIRTPVHKSAALSGFSEGGTPLITSDNHAYTYDRINKRLRKTRLQGSNSAVVAEVSGLNQQLEISSSGAFWNGHLVIAYDYRLEIRRLSDLGLVRGINVQLGNPIVNNPLVIGNNAYVAGYARIVRFGLNSNPISVSHRNFASFQAEGGTRLGTAIAAPTQVRDNFVALGVNQWGSGSSSSYPQSSFGQMLVFNSSLSSQSARTLTAGSRIICIWTGSRLIYVDVRGTVYSSTVDTSGTLGAPTVKTIRSGHSGGSENYNTWTRMIMPRNITYDGTYVYVDMRGVPGADQHIERGIWRIPANFSSSSSYTRIITMNTSGAQVMTATASQGNVLLVQDTSGYLNAYNSSGQRVNNFFVGGETNNSRIKIGSTLETGSAAINGGIGGYIAAIGGGKLNIFNTADSSPPSISFSPNGAGWRNSALNVTVTVTDAGNGAVAGVHQVWTYVSTSSSPPSSSSSSWGNPVRTFTAYQNSTTATVTIPASTGQRYIHVKATDRLGNERISTSAVYRTDVTAPSISANIQNRAWANSNVSVTLTFSDSHSGISTRQYAWSTSTSTPSSWSTYSSAVTQSNNGAWYLHARAVDSAGNVRTTYFGPYRIDKQPPTEPNLNLDQSWINGDRTFTVTGGSDAHSGVARLEYRIGSGAWTTYTTTTTALTTSGTIEVQARTVDNAGNVSEVVAKTARVDKTNPQPPTLNLDESWTNQDRTFTVTGGSDAHSGVAQLEYRIGTGSWNKYSSTTTALTTSGTVDVQARTKDNVGLYSTVITKTARVDKIKPSHTSHSISGARYVNGNDYWVRPGDLIKYKDRGYDAHSGITTSYVRLYNGSTDARSRHQWTGSATNNDYWSKDIKVEIVSAARTYDSGGYREIEWGISPNNYEQDYDIQWYYKDLARNESDSYGSSGFKLRVDNTPPTIKADRSDSGWSKDNISITLTYTDGRSGIKTKQYAWSKNTSTPTSWNNYTSPVSPSSDGVWYLHARAEDNVGFIATECFGPYRIDKTGPIIDANPKNRDWDKSNVTVTLNFSDSESGVSVKQYAWSTSTATPTSWSNYTSAVTQSSNGVWYLHARSVDNAGNETVTYFGPYRVDKAAPSISASPANRGWDKTDAKVTLTFSDSHSGISTRQYAWSTSTATPSSWSTYSGQVTQSNNGTWYLHARAVDNAGNVKTECFGPYRVDKAAPTIDANPKNRGWANSNVSVTLTFADSHSGVSTRQYAWSTSTATPSSWSSYTGAVTQSSNGVWYLHARAVDNAGNETIEYFGPYRVDKTAPSIIANITERGWASENVTVALTYTDLESGISAREYAWSTNTTTPSSWNNYSSPVTQSLDGVWYLHARAVDNSGNVTTECFGPYRIDKTSPSITANPSSRGWDNTDVSVTLTFSDGQSGVKTRQFAWSTSTSTPSAWSNYTSAVTQGSNGVWYLHARTEDNAGNITVEMFGPYRVDKELPSHSTHSISGYRYRKGNDYWVGANDTVKYKMRGYDLVSGIRYSYARLVGTNVDARAQHDWNAAANHISYFQTSEQVDFVGATRTYNSNGYKEIEWTIEFKDYENDFGVQYYYRDNATNSIGYNNTGMTLKVDTTSPVVTLDKQEGEMIPSDEITISVSDLRSGLKVVKYQWTDSLESPETWVDATAEIINGQATIRTNPPTHGDELYLHYYAEDNVGNITVGYSGRYNVIDDRVSIDGLALVKIVNPPIGAKVPVIYPVETPPKIRAGYKVDFIVTATGADEIDIRIYNQGELQTVYTDDGEKNVITLTAPSIERSNVRFTFWFDKETEDGTVFDMEIILKRSLPGNRSSIVANTTLGRNFIMIEGSSKRDSRINLIR